MTAAHWLWIPAVVLALAALGAGIRFGAPRSGAWAAVAALGQAAMLQLVHAGPLVGYQHLAPLQVARHDRLGALLVAVAFVLVALVGLGSRRAAISRWFHALPGRWFLVAGLLVASLLAAAPSAAPATWALELAAAAMLQLSALACVAMAAADLPDERVVALEGAARRWLDTPPGPPRLDRFSWLLAGFVAVIATALCLTSYEAVPHIPDEIAYLVQAKYFAAGLPWMPPPPVPAAFETFLVELDGDRWFSVFPPGWPLLLAVGVKLGVPWLVNPLLGGACILLTYLLVQELADRGLARLSITVLAVSPWHLLLSMSFMSHGLSLVLALVVALGALRAIRTGAWRPAVTGGLALGVLGMSRPLEGVVVGALAGLPLLWTALRRPRLAAVSAAVVGALVTGGLGLWYNRLITGSAFVFPAERYFDREYGPGRYGIGFGPEKGVRWTGLDPFPGHGLVDVGVNAVLNGFMVNVDFLGWAVGSLLIVVLGLRSARTAERWMMVAIGAVTGVHAAYWFSGGPDFGARYWYLIIVPCAVLAARGLATAGATARGPGGRTVAAGAWLSILALALFVPWRAVDKYRGYRGVRGDPAAWTSAGRFEGALVLVGGERHPDWASVAPLNEPEIGRSQAPVFAWDRDDATRQALLRAFPSRPVWLVAGPTVTRGAFEVIQGPVSPADREALRPR